MITKHTEFDVDIGAAQHYQCRYCKNVVAVKDYVLDDKACITCYTQRLETKQPKVQS